MISTGFDYVVVDCEPVYNVTTRKTFFPSIGSLKILSPKGGMKSFLFEIKGDRVGGTRRESPRLYLVEQEAHPGQRPAAPAAGVDAAAGAAEVEALEQLQQVVPRRRGRRHRQHPAGRGARRSARP